MLKEKDMTNNKVKLDIKIVSEIKEAKINSNELDIIKFSGYGIDLDNKDRKAYYNMSIWNKDKYDLFKGDNIEIIGKYSIYETEKEGQIKTYKNLSINSINDVKNKTLENLKLVSSYDGNIISDIKEYSLKNNNGYDYKKVSFIFADKSNNRFIANAYKTDRIASLLDKLSKGDFIKLYGDIKEADDKKYLNFKGIKLIKQRNIKIDKNKDIMEI